MRLLAPVELNAVLDLTQELVGAGQLRIIAVGKQAFVIQLAKAVQGAPGADPGIAAAVQTPQALGQELDVANAAPVELHVGRRGAALPQLLRLLLTRQERALDSPDIRRCAVHIGLDTAQELARDPRVARRMPRL